MGLDVQEIHILMIGLTGLIVVDCLQYLKQKKIAELLMGQWCVFRWAILICLIVSCIVLAIMDRDLNLQTLFICSFKHIRFLEEMEKE